tara:strand:- start:46 stop:402 length:357 start_codon:yes stop_codon:yes gene_type:complete
MANTYTWDFPTLDVCNEAQNGHADCIQTIHWRVIAVSDSETNADGEALTVTAYGTAGVTAPEEGDSDYVAFNSITKDWCKTKTLESLGKTEAEMQTMLDEQITALANPPMRQAVPAGW